MWLGVFNADGDPSTVRRLAAAGSDPASRTRPADAERAGGHHRELRHGALREAEGAVPISKSRLVGASSTRPRYVAEAGHRPIGKLAVGAAVAGGGGRVAAEELVLGADLLLADQAAAGAAALLVAGYALLD